MIWYVEYDKFGNRSWVSYVDGGEYRIIQHLKNDQIIYLEHSSSALWIDIYSSCREEWFTVEDAKYEICRHYLSNYNREKS